MKKFSAKWNSCKHSSQASSKAKSHNLSNRKTPAAENAVQTVYFTNKSSITHTTQVNNTVRSITFPQTTQKTQV